MRLLPILFLLLGTACASAQIEIKVEKRVRLEASGTADVWIWNAPLPLVTEQQGSTLLVDGPAGTYRVQVTGLTIDWDSKQFSQQNGFVDITLGNPEPGPEPGPGPGPGPSPDIPDDEFGIAVKVAEWARELKLNKTKEAAKNYEEAAARLLGEKEPILATIELAHKWTQEQNQKLGLNDEWLTWGKRVEAVWYEKVKNRTDAGNFYRAVGKGLEGA